MLQGHDNIEMDTTTLKWTRHVDTWQILKNTHDTCARHVSDTLQTPW